MNFKKKYLTIKIIACPLVMWLITFFHFVRNLILLLLNVPEKAIISIFLYFGIILSLCGFLVEGFTLDTILMVIIIWIVLMLAFRLVYFLYDFIASITESFLDLFDLEKIIVFLSRKFSTSIDSYIHFYVSDYITSSISIILQKSLISSV